MWKRWVALLVICALAAFAAAQKKMPKPGWNLFKKQQDIQLGREYAQQVERQMYVVPNKELNDYVTRVGMRLVRQGGLEDYPYYFKVVQDDSINAFALPGGPTYVHTGLLKAAENEAQLAGVLAHELSHVVLRHGTHQASRAVALQAPAMVLGGLAGRSGLSALLAQLGIGLGANSVLIGFSRSMESEADLLGAYTMAKAGYNPLELARFFEKLEAERGNPNWLVSRFLSDHPSPGNRIQALDEQLPYMPRGPYNAEEGDLVHIQQVVAQLSAPKSGFPRGQNQEPAGPSPAAGQVDAPAIRLSGSVREYTGSLQGGAVAFSYPEEWHVEVNPDASLQVSGENGTVGGALGCGVLVSSVPARNGKVELPADTKTYLQSLAQAGRNVKTESEPAELTAGDSPALATRLSSDSPYAGRRREIDMVVTVDRGPTMVVLILVAPAAQFTHLEDAFQALIRSLRFNP
jgi:Zn-dependent protease with chaperone function